MGGGTGTSRSTLLKLLKPCKSWDDFVRAAEGLRASGGEPLESDGKQVAIQKPHGLLPFCYPRGFVLGSTM